MSGFHDRITDPIRQAVLESVRSGISGRQTARDYNIDEKTVRRILRGEQKEGSPAAPEFLDKKVGGFNWRDAIPVMQSMQDLRRAASWSQRTAEIKLKTSDPIGLMVYGDQHIGAAGTDYRLFVELTDMLLNTPNLYACLVGDHVEMAIKLRGVAEVCAQLIDPERQLEFMESWLEEIHHKILFATWGNHTEDRLEASMGGSPMKTILAKKVPYFNGIGHPDLIVGDERYKLAASHKFQGVTQLDSTAGCKKYLRMEYPDGEVALQGDCHRTGVSIYNEGGKRRCALSSGTLNVRSTFAERYFSLKTSTAFPVVTFWPDKHQFVPFFCVQEFLDTMGY